MYYAVCLPPKNSVYWFVLCFLSVAKDHLFNTSEGGNVAIIV
ncbi:hypothetical protein KPK_4921 [Klebsiella variicola]|uniref:Uncharacterized protein n=1 Tax=Klebsiella variicola (strain 342) TaxID=507522 RepID=B5Y2L1_KLEV3|nr:hypothetical protein KPK_4921 [Klebsiella variicola]